MTQQTQQLPNRGQLKLQTKRLRSTLADQGQQLSHSAALEHIARLHGYTDWNTLSAVAEDHTEQPERPNDMTAQYVPGHWVQGHYMGQPFVGEVLGARIVDGDRYRLTIRFDEPVDVVEFESFSAWRQRVNVLVDRFGTTLAKRSNGVPHLVLKQGTQFEF